MTVQEVANRLVELCRKGEFTQAQNELYSQDISSYEPKGSPAPELHGIEAVTRKSEQFDASVEEMHGVEVSDPLVAENFFSVTMKMDVTFKGAPRFTMEEVAVYNVEDGKIINEHFFFTPQPMG